jgi:hypothetical protein
MGMSRSNLNLCQSNLALAFQNSVRTTSPTFIRHRLQLRALLAPRNRVERQSWPCRISTGLDRRPYTLGPMCAWLRRNAGPNLGGNGVGMGALPTRYGSVSRYSW